MAFPIDSTRIFLLNLSAISSSQGDENPLQKLTAPRHVTILLTLQKKIQGPSTFEMVLQLKPRLQKNRGFSISTGEFTTHNNQNLPIDLHQNFQTSAGSRSRVWGTWIYSTQKETQMVLVWMSTWDVFVCLGDVVFVPTVFCFGAPFFFVCFRLCMVLRIRLWVSYDCDTVILCDTGDVFHDGWWLVPMPPRIPTTAGPQKAATHTSL